MNNTKTCNECRLELPVEAFSKCCGAKDGLQAKCRKCQSKRWAEYKAQKGDELRAKQREYHKAPEVRARKRAYNTSDKMREWFRDYSHENREKMYQKERKYIDQKKANGGRFTAKNWEALKAMYGNKCLACGSTDRLVADHVIPVSLGGPNNIENRQLLCISCNSRKSDGTTDFRPKS